MTRLVMPTLMTLLLVGGVSAAAEPKKVSARDEIARLEKELAAQRALMVRMLELQNECTSQMIKAVQGQEVSTPALAEPPPPPPPAPSSAVSAPPLERAPMERPSSSRNNPRAESRRETPAESRAEKGGAKFASISGKVKVASGAGPAWVFVQDVKGPPPTASAEIKQEEKQFSPRVLAVPSGTRVTFPNLDVVFHNVFSLTPGQTFDLGMLRAGDPVKSKVMSKPGVLEIFCNLHARMSATVLVTPGPLLAKVGRDGSFTIENVPVGSHQVSAWAGGQAISTKTVDVGQEGGTVEFQLAAPKWGGAHTTKTGQPYGSYED